MVKIYLVSRILNINKKTNNIKIEFECVIINIITFLKAQSKNKLKLFQMCET